MSALEDHNPQKECPANRSSDSGAGSNASSESKLKSNRKNTKLVRVFRLFYFGEWWDYQTIRPHGDSCLHSSVSAYKNIFGFEFEDEWQTKNGFDGNPTRCKRWRLKRSPENLRRARAFLGLPNEQSGEATTR